MMRLRRFLFVAGWVLSVMIVVGARAQSDGASEHFPPNPQVEWKHLKLELRVEDMNHPVLEGVATYRIAPSGQRIETLKLDAKGFKVLSVCQGTPEGKPLEWMHEGDLLQVRLPEAIGPVTAGGSAAEASFAVTYRVVEPKNGLRFSSALPGVDGAAPVAAEIHTQGQPESNHHWFPVHDFPNIRLATEVIINLPAGVSASSNGRLVEHRSVGEREIWHWLQEQPHVPYLVSVVAGNFQRTELPAPVSGVPMSVWTRPSHAQFAPATYANTDRMMACFARVFGVKYPWSRYDQLVVRNFSAGGMENTSATTMNSGALLDSTALLEGDMDGLISHELCHQWTGDLMTCRSWEHIWLNEGWATYGTALWMEERDGPDGYYDTVLGSFDVGVADTGIAAADGTVPAAMCSKSYRNPGETFRRVANPYPKGASILHMLRTMLGDEVFFSGVHKYVAQCGGRLVETSDFRLALEAASGRSLEQFFTQWCMQSGTPRVKVSPQYEFASRVLTLEVEQSVRGGAGRAMSFVLPVVVRTATSERTIDVDMQGLKASRQIELDGPPTMIAVDPRLTVLKVLDVTTGDGLLIEQLRSGPTSASRRQAARALRSRDTSEVRDALAAVVRDTQARWTLREEAVTALSSIGSAESRAVLCTLFDELVVPTLGELPRDAAAHCHPQLRAALAESVAFGPLEAASSRLIPVLTRDQGYAPRIAAARGLARLGGIDFAADRAVLQSDEAVRAGLDAMLAVSTPNERVRSGALEAIGSLGLVESREHVAALGALGHVERLRPVAIATFAKIIPAKSDEAGRAKSIAWLVALLDDNEPRAQDAAGDALASIGATEALSRLDAMAANDRDEHMREKAAAWAKQIRAKSAAPQAS